MHSSPWRRAAIALAPALLALALAGCGKHTGAAGDAAPSGAPLARIAPPAGKAWPDVVAQTPEGGYRMGNPGAPIKLVEFGSLTCPHCAEFTKDAAAPLRDDYVASGRVSYEFRNFLRDGIDTTAAVLTHCGSPDSYFALTEQVFAHQKEMFDKLQGAGDAAYGQAMGLPPARRFAALARLTGLDAFFAARGVSTSAAAACLADPARADTLAKATEQASTQFGIDATPTFLVNGEKVESATWSDIDARLKALGAR